MNNIKERIRQQTKANILIQHQLDLHDRIDLTTGEHRASLVVQWNNTQEKITVLLEELSND